MMGVTLKDKLDEGMRTYQSGTGGSNARDQMEVVDAELGLEEDLLGSWQLRNSLERNGLLLGTPY